MPKQIRYRIATPLSKSVCRSWKASIASWSNFSASRANPLSTFILLMPKFASVCTVVNGTALSANTRALAVSEARARIGGVNGSTAKKGSHSLPSSTTNGRAGTANMLPVKCVMTSYLVTFSSYTTTRC